MTAWHERRDLAREVVARLAPTMRPLMDLEAVRDAAFCHRHREVTREHGKELAARAPASEARRTGAEWVVLFDDVTPLGSQRLEMHVAAGRALHTASRARRSTAPRPKFELEVVQLDPDDGAWLLDKAAAACRPEQFDRPEEWEARIEQARIHLRRGLT